MTEKVGFVTMGQVEKAGEIPGIGIGMLGYAFMGKAHSNAFKTLPYMMYPPPAIPRLVAIGGRTEEAVSEAARRYGYEKYYTDWHQLVHDPDVQILDNGAPNNLHAEPCIEAAGLGKHIICEKPLARTATEARRMWEAVQQAGVKHMVGFNYRFVPAVRLARDMVRSGELGEIYHYRAHYLQEWIMDPNFELVWRLQGDVAGSGALGDLGAHIIDLGRFIVGEPARVSGIMKTFIKERPTPEGGRAPVTVDDAFEAWVEFDNGAIGTLEASRFAKGRKNHEVFEINGSKGSLRFNMERMNELEVHLPGQQPQAIQPGFTDVLVSESYHPYWKFWWPQGHIIGYEHTFTHEIYHFLDAVVNNKDIAPYGATFEDGYRCAVILDAIIQSSTEGRRIDIAY
ncbi:MAG: Gfo/Idh/MocA family oxidoreductase [Chloroflexi bacterium]|nr:Gfo/Idh/MocA family oxidoreductase [Chloroflexota bacterium]